MNRFNESWKLLNKAAAKWFLQAVLKNILGGILCNILKLGNSGT